MCVRAFLGVFQTDRHSVDVNSAAHVRINDGLKTEHAVYACGQWIVRIHVINWLIVD